MPERTSYANGVPSWVDLASTDVDKSVAFYGGLFGWEYALAGSREETGGYGMFMIDGKNVAGLVQMNEMWPDGVPPHWHVYFVVADAAAEHTKELGGSVHVEPFDAPGVGRMSVVSDSNGTHFSIIALADLED